MSGSTRERVGIYVDTNVWISSVYENDVNHTTAESLMRELQARGDVDICISSLVLMEILDHLKDLAMNNQEVTKDPTPDAIGKFVNDTFWQLYGILYGTKGFSFQNPNVQLTWVYWRAKEILNRVFGEGRRIQKKKRCRECGYVEEFQIHRYRGPKRDDVMHALIAKYLGCRRFVTFDTGFNFLQGDSSLNGLQFDIIQGR
jgi:predicted nucleic acid-binding protein